MIAVSPKRLFLLMLVVLLPVQAAAQAQRTANDAINMSVSRIQRGGQRMLGTLKPTEQSNKKKKAQDKPLNHLYVDPQTTKSTAERRPALCPPQLRQSFLPPFFRCARPRIERECGPAYAALSLLVTRVQADRPEGDQRAL